MEKGIVKKGKKQWFLNLDTKQSYSENTMKQLCADEKWWEIAPKLARIMSNALEKISKGKEGKVNDKF